MYLYPLVKDKIKEEKYAAALKELRNRISVAFLLLNTIFVVVIFVMMQFNMDVLYIPWPIGLVFMMTCGIIMVVQIIRMLVDRTTTLTCIMTPTVLRFTPNEETNEIMRELARRLGRIDYALEHGLSGTRGG